MATKRTSRRSRSSRRVGSRLYVGRTAHGFEVFRSAHAPTETSHGHKYRYTIGPFRTMRGARFMADHGSGNPHCQSVADAENLAKGLKYDIALGRWV